MCIHPAGLRADSGPPLPPHSNITPGPWRLLELDMYAWHDVTCHLQTPPNNPTMQPCKNKGFSLFEIYCSQDADREHNAASQRGTATGDV